MEKINEFNIIEKVGDNPPHSYYRAYNKQKEFVLLKIIRKNSPDDIYLCQQLRREFEICRSLQIQGVIQPIKLIDKKNLAALIIEGKGSKPLNNILLNGPLELTLTIRLAQQLASILAELHHCNYVHNNIQPASILLNPTSQTIELHGLGISTQIPRRIQGVNGFGIHQENPAYISPEQSGRTNRLVDYRTDFYSLGITLFECLTGRHPFGTDTDLKLIHSHIARLPPSPIHLCPSIPQAMADIVLKLMAKSPENRYQGGRGLLHDLTRCLMAIEQKGKITPFVLGQKDTPTRFEFSQKFYGRKKELKILTDIFNTISHGKIKITLVSGYPGVGKTAFVQELRNLTFINKGWFVAGKYDLPEHNTPYCGIREALSELCRRLLAEIPDKVAQYRKKLTSELGKNIGVMTQMVKELESIVGKAPPFPNLDSIETQNRFHVCFLQTLQVLATEDNPLVLFLDDLQWADQSSLDLIEGILNQNLHNVMLIGACRHNELNEAHPLMQILNSLKEKNRAVQWIILPPLQLPDVRQLVADSLRMPIKTTNPLADLVFRKTAGNAFFTKAFLLTLYEKNLIYLESSGTWQWNMDLVAKQDTTENVAKLAIRKIAQMPKLLRHVISMAAVLGSTFDPETLAAVVKAPVEDVETKLIDACT